MASVHFGIHSPKQTLDSKTRLSLPGVSIPKSGKIMVVHEGYA